MVKEDNNTVISCSYCKGIWLKSIQKESDFRFDYLTDNNDSEQLDNLQKKFAWKDIIVYEGTYMNSRFFTNSEENTYCSGEKAITSMNVSNLTLQNSNFISAFGIDKNIVNRLKYKTISILQIATQHFANQLCYIDAKLVNLIEWSELSTGLWLSKDSTTLAKNVLGLSTFFNKLTQIVVHTIVSLKKPIERKNAIEYFIKVAEALFKSNNFNSLQAIVCSLNQQAIHRLKQTWKLVSPTYLQKYEKFLEFLDMEDNYKTYRTKLKEIMAARNTFLPFFGIFLTDVNGVISYIKFKKEQVDKFFKETPKEEESIAEMMYNTTSPLRKAGEVKISTKISDDDIYGCSVTTFLNEEAIYTFPKIDRQNAGDFSTFNKNIPQRAASNGPHFRHILRTTPISNNDQTEIDDISRAAEKAKDKNIKKKFHTKEKKFGAKKYRNVTKITTRALSSNFEIEESDANASNEVVNSIKKELDDFGIKMKEIEDTFYTFKIQAAYYVIEPCQLVPALILVTDVPSQSDLYKNSLKIEPTA